MTLERLDPQPGERLPGLPRVTVTLWRPHGLIGWVDYLLGAHHLPRASRSLIIADAEDLLNRYEGPYAFAVACARCDPRRLTIDENRPENHWAHVKGVIAYHIGIRTGAGGWRGGER